MRSRATDQPLTSQCEPLTVADNVASGSPNLQRAVASPSSVRIAAPQLADAHAECKKSAFAQVMARRHTGVRHRQ